MNQSDSEPFDCQPRGWRKGFAIIADPHGSALHRAGFLDAFLGAQAELRNFCHSAGMVAEQPALGEFQGCTDCTALWSLCVEHVVDRRLDRRSLDFLHVGGLCLRSL